MPTVKEIRRRNLLTVLTFFGGNQAALAAALEVEPSYVSQLVAGSAKGGRNIGDRTARKIEVAIEKPEGWMDQPHAANELEPRDGASAGNNWRTVTRLTSRSVKIPQVMSESEQNALTPVIFSIPVLEIEASMGVGKVEPEYETIIGRVDLNERFVRTHFPNITSPQNLRLITGMGDSMKGTYEDGSPLFADVGVQEVRVDAVYVFALNGEVYVKRLQKRPDGTINVISDNEKYPPYSVTRRDKIRVIGRIVGGWNWFRL